MTQEEIIEMAKTVRSSGYWDAFDLINFAKLVADVAIAKEREACANHVKHLRNGDDYGEFLAKAIRSRGEA